MIKSPLAQRDPGDRDFVAPQLLCIWDKIKLMDHNSGFFLHGFYISHIAEFFGYDFSVERSGAAQTPEGMAKAGVHLLQGFALGEQSMNTSIYL